MDAIDELAMLQSDPHQETNWPELSPLPPILPTAPGLDLELAKRMLPEPIQAWVIDFATRAQVAAEAVAVACLGTIASVVGRKIGIHPKRLDNWWVPCVFWTAIVARPGERKSSILSHAQRPLDGLEYAARELFKKEAARAEAEKEVIEQRINAIKDQLKSAAKKHEGPKILNLQGELGELLKDRNRHEVHQRRYRTNDSTVEMLSVLLKGNPNGLLVVRDELIGLFRSFERTGHETDRAFYLEGWDASGAPYTADRIGRGTIVVESLCLHMLGGIQPGRLQEFVRQAVDGGGGDDGLLQRLQLLVYPEPASSVEYIDRAPDHDAFEQAERIFKWLADLEVPTSGSSRPALRFSDEAQALYQEWSIELERRYRLADDEHPAFVSHLSKYQRLMPALALLFRLIVDADSRQLSSHVGLKEAQMAAAWCEFLEKHARKVYAIVERQDLRDAAAILKRIKRGDIEDGMTIRDIARKGWAPFGGDADAIKAAVTGVLEHHGIARIVEERKQVGRGSAVVRIHPELRNRGQNDA